jgi:hypothetical protein
MFKRARIRIVAIALLGFLGFAQTALAVARCDWQERSPARAVAGSDVPPCHEAVAEIRNANLCLAHCQNDAQSLDKASFSIHAMPAAPVLAVTPLMLVEGVSRLEAAALRIAPPGAPPPRILYHSFLE